MSTHLGASGIALLVLTLICWLILLIYLFGFAGQQAHGDAAFGQAFSFFAAVLSAGLTWLWLGGLLLKAGTQDMMPRGFPVAAATLYLASAAATAAAFFLLQDPSRVWPAVIPALVPPLLALYVIALYVPFLRPTLGGLAGSLAFWGAILILSISPWPAFVAKVSADNNHRIAQVKGQEEWELHQAASNRAANLEKLQAMTPDQPLMNWYPLLEPSSGVRPEALEALRHVDRRQSDIEDMLSYGIMQAMMLLPELDLQPTPLLCSSAQTFLLKTAKESRVRPKQDPRPYEAGSYADQSLPGLRWLVAHGCDCDEGIAALEAATQSYIESPARNQAVAALAQLRKKP